MARRKYRGWDNVPFQDYLCMLRYNGIELRVLCILPELSASKGGAMKLSARN